MRICPCRTRKRYKGSERVNGTRTPVPLHKRFKRVQHVNDTRTRTVTLKQYKPTPVSFTCCSGCSCTVCMQCFCTVYMLKPIRHMFMLVLERCACLHKRSHLRTTREQNKDIEHVNDTRTPAPLHKRFERVQHVNSTRTRTVTLKQYKRTPDKFRFRCWSSCIVYVLSAFVRFTH